MNLTIEETVEQVEHLYAALTGKSPPPPNGSGAVIPPEADPLTHVEQQVGRMVQAVERLLTRTLTPMPEWIPGVVVGTRDGEVVVSLDVPGVLREDVEIRVRPHVLTVAGQRRLPASQLPRNVSVCDAALGQFARSFPLGAGVTPAHVSARLDGGVLTIRIHNGARTEPSEISITS